LSLASDRFARVAGRIQDRHHAFMKILPVRRLVLPLLAVVFASATAGCLDSVAQRKAASEIKQLLPQYLGPADSYEVQVEGSANQIRKGMIENIHVVGINLQPFDLPQLSRIEADIKNIHVDMGNKTIISSDLAEWVGWMSEDVATELLREKVSYIKDVKAELQTGVVWVSGKVTIKGIGPTARVEARPAVRKDREIWMSPTKVQSYGVGVDVPDWGQKRVDPFINPIFVIPDNRLQIRLKTLKSEPKMLKMTGTFNPMGFNP